MITLYSYAEVFGVADNNVCKQEIKGLCFVVDDQCEKAN
jgi:hypothetical protein